MDLKYRLHTTADEPALAQLWSQHGGWDELTVETFRERLIKAPLGESAVVVAEDSSTGDILGQFTFIPCRVVIDGDEYSALRPFAPILHATARNAASWINPLKHPIVAMYFHAVEALRARGDALIFMVPDPRWRRLFRVFPFVHLGSFPLWSRRLPLNTPVALPNGFQMEPLRVDDARIDALWLLARRQHRCQLLRDTRVLPWKIGGESYDVTGVVRDCALAGLIASKRQKEDRQWLLCDVLAADTGDALKATLTAGTLVADERARAWPEKIAKVAILKTSAMHAHLQHLSFTRDAYDFPMVVHTLDSSLARSTVAPENWYVSAND
jgi:hypothetical protein